MQPAIQTSPMSSYFKSTYFKPLSVATLLLWVLAIALPVSVAQSQEQADDSTRSAEFEQLLAPIALYPDTILSHILVAATYPLEVVQAERWTLQNPDLQGQEAVNAAEKFDWDPSVQALVAFPDILTRMSQDLDWTQRLGSAFLQNEEQLLASVQHLRELAAESGSLEQMDKVSVTRDDKIIIIEPRKQQIVYVPYYDSRVVYGPWRWHAYQPIFWDYPYSARYYDRHSAFYWGPGIPISYGFYSNAFHWHNYHVVRISPRHYRPHRYYSRSDILAHQNAQRWAHDVQRGAISSNRPNFVREDERVQRGSASQQTAQEHIQSRLADHRSPTEVQTQSQRIDISRARTSPGQRATTDRSSEVLRSPIRTSPTVLPERIRAAQESRERPAEVQQQRLGGESYRQSHQTTRTPTAAQVPQSRPIVSPTATARPAQQANPRSMPSRPAATTNANTVERTPTSATSSQNPRISRQAQ